MIRLRVHLIPLIQPKQDVTPGFTKCDINIYIIQKHMAQDYTKSSSISHLTLLAYPTTADRGNTSAHTHTHIHLLYTPQLEIPNRNLYFRRGFILTFFQTFSDIDCIKSSVEQVNSNNYIT